MVEKPAKGRMRNTRDTLNNRANQLNPNNDAYWQSRGHDKRPRDKNNAPATRKK